MRTMKIDRENKNMSINRLTMEYKGFKAQIMEARRLTGKGVHGLPQGTPIPVYYSDEFLKLPENWMRGPGVFVIPVRPEKGLWFNWRDNDELNTAVIPTVKGANPITGLQTSGFHLEQYDTKCPKHGCDFLADRFCQKCNHKWENRNYCSMSPLWWDGFRADDGTVRQFFFTEDSMRDVATALIGKEQTVPAFGFAFYSTKVKREIKRVERRSGYEQQILFNNATLDSLDFPVMKEFSSKKSFNPSKTIGSFNKGHTDTSYSTESSFLGSPELCGATLGSTTGGDDNSKYKKSASHRGILRQKLEIQHDPDTRGVDIPEQKPVIKDVSIGAGAKIRQKLNDDNYSLENWNDSPDAVMTIYFVFHDKFEEIKAGGMRDLSGKSEGMLNGIPVG